MKYCNCCGRKLTSFGYKIYTEEGIKHICWFCNLYFQENDKLPSKNN